MGLVGRISKIVTFLRTGYPANLPLTGYLPLAALLPRRPSEDEITAIACELILHGRRPIDAVDIGVEITRMLDAVPVPDDVLRVQTRLSEIV